MIRRTALIVAVLAAAALALAPQAMANPMPQLPAVPALVPADEPLVPVGGPSVPAVDANVHAEAQTDNAPVVQVDGRANVGVDPEESAVPTQDDGAAEAQSLANDAATAGPGAPVAVASAAVGLFAVLALGIEAIRVAASNAWAHVARAVRGAARFAIMLPLFSRIARADLLDNPVRARIHTAVTETPGLSLSDIKSCMGIAWGTAVHHLEKLERSGMVVSATQRGHRRYFVAGTPEAQRRNDIAIMVHPTAHRIAALVSTKPGIDQTGICRALRLNNPAASKHLRGFEAQGLVLATRDGRKRLYHPTASMEAALPFVQATHMESATSVQRHSVPMAGVAAFP